MQTSCRSPPLRRSALRAVTRPSVRAMVGCSPMAQTARPVLPPEHEPLARDLAALPAPVRAAVVARAESLAKGAPKAASWASIDALGGVLSLGGDALRDTDALYDG